MLKLHSCDWWCCFCTMTILMMVVLLLMVLTTTTTTIFLPTFLRASHTSQDWICFQCLLNSLILYVNWKVCFLTIDSFPLSLKERFSQSLRLYINKLFNLTSHVHLTAFLSPFFQLMDYDNTLMNWPSAVKCFSYLIHSHLHVLALLNCLHRDSTLAKVRNDTNS